MRRIGWIEDFFRDARYALRALGQKPTFAAMAVVSLAVGIAAATGLFSVVHAALLNPFPFADVDRIVGLDVVDKGTAQDGVVTGRQLVALQQSEVLDGALVSNTWDMHVYETSHPVAHSADDMRNAPALKRRDALGGILSQR